MAWLKLKEGETIHAAIDFSSIKSIPKHWTGQRSELCLGTGCPHCLAHIPKRWRYQAQVLVDGSPFAWEFGDTTMTDLTNIPHDTNWARITITRVGEARHTQYRVRDQFQINYQEIVDQRTEELVRRYHGHDSAEEER